jgi:hypothetical protein
MKQREGVMCWEDIAWSTSMPARAGQEIMAASVVNRRECQAGIAHAHQMSVRMHLHKLVPICVWHDCMAAAQSGVRMIVLTDLHSISDPSWKSQCKLLQSYPVTGPGRPSSETIRTRTCMHHSACSIIHHMMATCARAGT